MKYYFLALGTLVFVCVGCAIDGQQLVDKGEMVAPPPHRLQRPGPMVDGPGPGVLPMMGAAPTRSFASKTTQVRFVGPRGMNIGWKIGDRYAENQITTPQRYNFNQGATFRLKMTEIQGRDGLVLYPSLQVYPSHPTTDAYLSHNSVPLELTDEDLDQIESNNFVTKVIYLPDPKFQELAIAGVETLVSTRLDPGVDPVAEADRRGTVMVVLRVGNMDLEMPSDSPMPPQAGVPGGIEQVSFQGPDGSKGQHVAPIPVAFEQGMSGGIPGPMMMGGMGMGIGQPPYNPIAGAPGGPRWGMPMTSTPIGLPGPAHLPLGGPASLQSYTIRNNTVQDLPKPVEHFLVDVKQSPGIRMPAAVNHVEIEETHPTYSPGAVSYPKFAVPGMK